MQIKAWPVYAFFCCNFQNDYGATVYRNWFLTYVKATLNCSVGIGSDIPIYYNNLCKPLFLSCFLDLFASIKEKYCMTRY